MKLGVVVDGGGAFIPELLDDWQAHYDVEVFDHRDIEVRLFQEELKWFRLKRALRAFLQRNDVVIFEWAGPLLVFASSFAGNLPKRARILTRLHSYELYEYAPHIRWEAVDRVILVSRAMQRRFSALYPATADRTSVVYHGKSLDKFAPGVRTYTGVLGMLGNLIPVKRIYETILCVYEANRTGMNLTLRIGGAQGEGTENARYFAAMQRLVTELDLVDQVFFEGHTADPAAFLRQIDIFISNSYWEGQQNALLEAMATGCYCLSHFWDGADEVLPPEYLFVTDVELREKIRDYAKLSDPERQHHKARMRSIVTEKFDFRLASQAFRAIIDNVSQRPGPRP